MTKATDCLKYFLALADQGPEQRPALADELTAFLADWPAECPDAMRRPVETLLEMTLREIGADTRRMLAIRFGNRRGLPLHLANAFYLYAPPDVRRKILMRNKTEGTDQPQATAAPDALMAAARGENNDAFVARFADALHIAPATATAIFADGSGEALAAACKGAGMGRTIFSMMAVLKLTDGNDTARLDMFDAMPEHAARSLLAFWQSQDGAARKAA